MKYVFTFAFVVSMLQLAFTQVTTYTFSQQMIEYRYQKMENILGNASNSGLLSFLNDTGIASTATSGEGIPIGFDFIYRGIIYNRFGVVNSGWLALGHSKYGTHAVDLGQLSYHPLENEGPAVDTLRARISAFDANLSGNGSGSSLSYELIGESPNRSLVVKWANYRLYSTSSTNFTRVNFEIVLNEFDNSIEINYGDFVTFGFSGTTNNNIGLGGLTKFEFNNRKTLASRNWNQTTAGQSFSDDCVLASNASMPIFGTSFRFSPPTCFPVPSVNFNSITSTAIQVVYNHTAPSPYAYQYALSQNMNPPASGILTTDSTLSLNNLLPNTTYYFHIRNQCALDTFSTWTSHEVKTSCNVSSLPYFENFDNVASGALPECFYAINSESLSPAWKVSEDFSSSAPNSLFLDWPGSYSTDDVIILPPVSMLADSIYFVSLDVALNNNANDFMVIYQGTKPNIDSMTVVDTVFSIDAFHFFQYYFRFTAPNNEARYFAFHSKSYYAYIDNISILPDRCSTPVNLNVSNNTGTEITIHWDHSSMTDTFEYFYTEIEEYPFLSSFFVSADSVVLTALTPGHRYYFYLRQQCGTNQFSEWTYIVFDTKSAIDECSDAPLILTYPEEECIKMSIFATIGATASPYQESTCGGKADDDVWLKFVSTFRSHKITVYNQCSASGGGGGTRKTLNENTNCGALIVELYKTSCTGDFIECISIPPTHGGSITYTQFDIGDTIFLRIFGADTLDAGQNFGVCITSFSPPSNDLCASATLLTVNNTCNPNFQSEVNLAGCLTDTAPAGSCFSGNTYDVWYKFVATSTTHLLEAIFREGVNGVLEGYSGSCNNLGFLACNNVTSTGIETLVLNNLTIGNTYYVRAFDAENLGLNSRISICLKNLVPNDECSNAINITSVTGAIMEDYKTTSTATATGTGECNSNFADDDVWYKFTATHTNHIIVAIPCVPSPQIETPVIELLDGNCNASSIQCSNNGELLCSNLLVGKEYYFKIYSKALDSGKGNFRVSISVPLPYFQCHNALTLAVNQDIICDTITAVSSIGAGVKNEIWIKFVALTPHQIITIENETIGPPSSAVLFDSCNAFTPLVYQQNYGFLHYKHFVPGHTYFLKLSSPYGPPSYDFGQDTFQICITPVCSNDECENAVAILPGDSCIFHSYSSLASTPSSGFGTCLYGGSNDVWYEFIATSTYHRIEIEGSGNNITAAAFDGCENKQIACFDNALYNSPAYGHLDKLEIGKKYKVRVSAETSTSLNGNFDLCLVNAPSNDLCRNAYELSHPLSADCKNEIQGTLVNASPSLGRVNVWYKFNALAKEVVIDVKPFTAGFDPCIRLWTATTGGHPDQCVFDTKEIADVSHLDFEAEVMIYNNLVLNATYYIEIYGGSMNTHNGDFSICLTGLSDNMQLYSANFSPYLVDTIAESGAWHQAITIGKIFYSGNRNNLVINELNFHISDTLFSKYLNKAYVYFLPQVFNTSTTPNETFMKFGQPGSGILSTGAPPILFGQAQADTNGNLTFKGQYTLLPIDVSNLSVLKQYLYLVYDLKCNTPVGVHINAKCDTIKFNNRPVFLPSNASGEGPALGNNLVFDTKQDGNWNDAATWTCDEVPPDYFDLQAVNINHKVVLSDTVRAGNININFHQSLSLLPTAYLELGRASTGNQSGYSNKVLDCTNGSLYIDHAALVINGQLKFGSWSGDQRGDGICCENGFGNYWLYEGNQTLIKDSTFLNFISHPFCIGSAGFNNDIVSEKKLNTVGSESMLFQPARDYDLQNFRSSNQEVKAIFQIDEQVHQNLFKQKPDKLTIHLPNENGSTLYELNLNQDNSFINEVKVFALPSKEEIKIDKGIHYKGTIVGHKNSRVTMAVFPNEIIYHMVDEGGNYVVRQVNKDQYMMYRYQDEKAELPVCGINDDTYVYSEKQLASSSEVFQKCIKIQLQAENDIVLQKGGIGGAFNYLTALFHQVALLYENDSINLTVGEMNFWTQPSPYTGTSAQQILEKYSNAENNTLSDLNLFLSYQFNGGYAYINGLCNDNLKFRCGYAGIVSSYQDMPNYSWSVYVMAHEIGHLLGSRHTHACSWNGNGTAIDGCFEPEGGCAYGDIPSNGGTIMSYCHFTDEGINFSLGLGDQPRNVIHYNIINASCIDRCNAGICNDHLVSLDIKTDNYPRQCHWEIVNTQNQVLYSGGPYNTAQHSYHNEFCLDTGCYKLHMYDASNFNAGGVFEVNSGKITIDANDGNSQSSVPADNFIINSSNFHFDNIEINILDPSVSGHALLFAPFNNNFTTNLNGKLTVGGGDDAFSTGHLGFNLRTTSFLQGFNVSSILRLDTLHVKGGLYDQNRHASSSGNFNYVGELMVDTGCEYEGRIGIDRNIVNNGIITSGTFNNEFISLGGKMDIGNQYINNFDLQTISGSGHLETRFMINIQTSNTKIRYRNLSSTMQQEVSNY